VRRRVHPKVGFPEYLLQFRGRLAGMLFASSRGRCEQFTLQGLHGVNVGKVSDRDEKNLNGGTIRDRRICVTFFDNH